MKDEYTRTATTVSLINYHFVFCPKYRRKIFNIPMVEDRFKELVGNICDSNSICILAMECHIDHVHLFLRCLPTQSPSEVMKLIKGGTSYTLRREFKCLTHMPTLWTRSYFVSTAGNVCSDTIRRYVETQKTRS